MSNMQAEIIEELSSDHCWPQQNGSTLRETIDIIRWDSRYRDVNWDEVYAALKDLPIWREA